MLDKAGKENPLDSNDIHEFYMSILNCIPNSVYWVDSNCRLQGCNNAFVKLIGLKKLNEFNDTPYQPMKNLARWDDSRVEQLKLDDMQVLFSGKAHYNKDEAPIKDKMGNTRYFQSTRVPIRDNSKKTIGLIVVLTDVNENKTEKRKSVSSKKTKSLKELTKEHVPHVLMIEDNVLAQTLEKAMLTELHCEVDIAESLDNALKLFNPGKYDLVLMDIGLEDSSGYVVAKKLRQLEKNTRFHVPIVALTGYEADVVKYDCEQYFMEGAITKPLTSEQAEQLLKHYVYHLDTPVQGLKQS